MKLDGEDCSVILEALQRIEAKVESSAISQKITDAVIDRVRLYLAEETVFRNDVIKRLDAKIDKVAASHSKVKKKHKGINLEFIQAELRHTAAMIETEPTLDILQPTRPTLG